MKTFASDNEIKELVSTFETLLPKKTRERLRSLSEKHSTEFYNSLQRANVDAFFAKITAEINALPSTDRWRKSIERRNDWNARFNSIHVSDFLEYKGYSKDYSFLCSFEPRELEYWLLTVCQRYEIERPTIKEAAHTSGEKLFSPLQRKNCDKAALQATQKVIDLLNSLEPEQFYRLPLIVAKATEEGALPDFKIVHDLLHKTNPF